MRKLNCTTVRLGIATGFTLIELIVAIVLMVIGFGLLLPSVQASREAARRVQCANHLYQLGSALHQYHNLHGHLPPGIESESGRVWSGSILPQLEQQSLYEKIDSDQTLLSGVDSDLLRVQLSVFRCPSAVVPETLSHEVENRVPTTYLGCISGTENRETGPDHRLFDLVQTGVLYRDSRTKLEHIFDGTSCTVLIGETLVAADAIEPDHSGVKQYVDHWAIARTDLGLNEVSESLGSTAAPIGIALSDDASIYPDDKELSFSSHHPSGIQFLFCDGHISVVSRSVDPTIYGAIGTRNTRERTSL